MEAHLCGADQGDLVAQQNRPSTMDLVAGEAVTEIEVFEVCLSASPPDEAVQRQIDKEIP